MHIVRSRSLSRLLGIIRKFYQYLYGREFTITVDNKPIQQIFHPAKDLPAFTASRMIRYRYAVYLSQFQYKIHDRPAQNHQNVDYLSRHLYQWFPENTIDESTFLLNERVGTVRCAEKLREETEKAPELSKLENGTKGDEANPDYSINDGILFKNMRIMIPRSLQ